MKILKKRASKLKKNRKNKLKFKLKIISKNTVYTGKSQIIIKMFVMERKNNIYGR